MPKVTRIIRILIKNLKTKSLNEVSLKNRNNSDIVPTMLPKSNLLKDKTRFRILLVPNKRRKSKKKLIIKTKSKYTFIISPGLVYKEKNDLYVV